MPSKKFCRDASMLMLSIDSIELAAVVAGVLNSSIVLGRFRLETETGTSSLPLNYKNSMREVLVRFSYSRYSMITNLLMRAMMEIR